jgi:glycosyltransferase involved in cell wall biosynthesis
VDNASTDRTAEVARSCGATVVPEHAHNVACVRNTGAAKARGDVLLFLDADTAVPPHFLERIAEIMADPSCLGGAPELVHRPASRILRLYLSAWAWVGKRLGMAQGAAQFCRAAAFRALNGYDESQCMGEDVDFYWRLRRLARSTGARLTFLDDVRVIPSSRRFDRTPVWRTLIWTNPAFILPLRKTKAAWAEWYEHPPR